MLINGSKGYWHDLVHHHLGYFESRYDSLLVFFLEGVDGMECLVGFFEEMLDIVKVFLFVSELLLMEILKNSVCRHDEVNQAYQHHDDRSHSIGVSDLLIEDNLA